MPTDNSLDRIYEKIRNLKAMANSNSVHEAATAAKKLQELLFKHNLELSGIPDRKKSEYLRDRVELGEGRALAWKRELVFPVAAYNFCRAFYHHDVDNRGRLHRVNYMGIVGEPHNIEMVRYLMDYLSGEIIRLSESLWASEGYGAKVSWKQQFCYGAVQGVSEVLKEQFEKDRQAEVQTMALVVVKDKDLQEALKKLVKLSPMSLTGATGAAGYSNGKAAGKNIQIRKGVGDSSPIGGLLS